MTTFQRVSIAITTDGSGNSTDYSAAVQGFLDNVFFDFGSLATGSDLTITEESTGDALLTITNTGVADLTWRPRVGVHPVANTAGGTLAPGGQTTGGDGNADQRLPVSGRIKCVTAQGDAATSGTLYCDIVS